MPNLAIRDNIIDCDLILFDFDGTLVEDSFRNSSLGTARFEEIERLASRESALKWATLSGYDTETHNVDSRGPLTRASRKEDIVVATAAIWQQGMDWYDAKKIAEKAYSAADKVQSIKYIPELFPGTREALKDLIEAGFKLGVATNGSGLTAQEILTAVGVADLFQVFTGAEEVTDGKPDPAMLHLACKRTGVDPSKAVYVGDENTDMEAGIAAGFAAVIAVEVDSDLSDLADLVLDSVSDLVSLTL